MPKITVRPINYRGFMTPEKLKRYASDPNVFVMYNVHALIEGLYMQHKHLDKMPSFDECYRVKPLKWLYDTTNEDRRALNIEALCYNIDSGHYTIFRRVVMNS